MNNVGVWKLYVYCVIDVIKSINKHSCVRLIVKCTESKSSNGLEIVQT